MSTGTEKAADVASRLAEALQGRVCVLGVGNRQRRDDGAGSWVAEALARRFDTVAIDGGSVPENHLEKVVRSRADTVLVIDAVDLAADPGELRIVEPDAIRSAGLSSHALSLATTAEFLRLRTGARVLVLGIQPADLSAGVGLSPAVSRAVERITSLLAARLCAEPG